MRRYAVVLISALLGALTLAGCGKDNKSTAPASTEQQYEALKPTIDSMVVDLIDYLSRGTELMESFTPDSLPRRTLPPLAAEADTFGYEYRYQNGWHILKMFADLDSLEFEWIDSLRFTSIQGLPQAEPDTSTTNALRLIEHMSITSTMAVMHGAMSNDVDFSFTGFQTSIITADGDADLDMDVAGTEADGAYDVDVACGIDINTVTISNPHRGGNGCPRGGGASLDFGGTFSGHDDDGNAVSGSADVTASITFNQTGAATVQVTMGSTQYTSTVNACPGQ